jgi:hypothetical protein
VKSLDQDANSDVTGHDHCATIAVRDKYRANTYLFRDGEVRVKRTREFEDGARRETLP